METKQTNRLAWLEVGELKIMAQVGMILMLGGFAFGFGETIYFGCNWHPMSKAERLCDVIAGFVTFIGCGFFVIAIALKTIHDIKNLK